MLDKYAQRMLLVFGNCFGLYKKSTFQKLLENNKPLVQVLQSPLPHCD